MAEMDDILTPDPRFIIDEAATGGSPDDLLKPDPRYSIDIPKQDFGAEGNTAKLETLVKEQTALKVKWTKTEEDLARIKEIEDEKNFLTVPMFMDEFQTAKLDEQRQGLEYATAPWELFFGIGAGQTITRLGTAPLRGVLTRAATIGGVAAATDIPIDILSINVAKEHPWLGIALGIGLSIPVAMYVDARVEEKIFRKILFRNPKFFSDNLSKIVTLNTKNVSAQVKARIEVLKNRIGEGDYAAFLESQRLLRTDIYQEIDPVKLTKLPQENLKIPTQKEVNRAALKKSFADVKDADLDEIQKLAQIQAISGHDQAFTKVRNKVNNKLALEAYRDHPITAMTETIRRQGGFSEQQLISMIGPEAVASLKKRFPHIVQKSGMMRVTDVAEAIAKKLVPDVKVIVVKTPNELPQRIKDQQAKLGRTHMGIRGTYNDKLKTLHLVQSTLKDRGEATLTGVHEIIHTKIKKLADKFPAVYDANKAAIDKMGKSLGITDTMRMTEEWLTVQISYEMLFKQGTFSFGDALKRGVQDRTSYFPDMAKPNITRALGLKGQVNPIHKAVALGYGSVEEMLYDFMQMPTLGKIKRFVAKDMQYDWDILYLNEYAARVGGSELKMWEKIGGKKLVQRARAAAKRDALLIGTKPKLLRDIINEVNFIRKVGTQAVRATLRTAKAQARLTQLVRADAMKSSIKESKEISTLTGKLSNALREKEIPYDFQVQIHGYLAPYVKGAIVNDVNQLTMREFLNQKVLEGVPTAKLMNAQYDEVLDITRRVTSREELSLDEYRKITGLVKDMVKMGKQEIVVDKIATRRLVEEFVRPIKETADKTFLQKQARPTQREWLLDKPSRIRDAKTAITDKHQKLFSELKRAEFILRELDAWAEFGPAQRLFQTAKFAEDQKFQIAKVLRERWEGLLSDYAKSYGKRILKNKFWNKVYNDSIVKGFGASKEKMLTMAGMTGNAHNKVAMLKSIGASEILVNRFLRENMTKQDWAFVKGVWEMTDSMYGMLNTAHKRMRNAPIPKVDNYWPIIPDYFFTQKKVVQHIEDVFLDMPHLQKVSKSVQKRFFHARVGNADSIRMDFSGLAKHFRDVAHTTSHWEATDDIRKIITNRTFKTAVQENLGDPKYRVLKQWYEDLVQPAPVDAPGFRKMRANVTVAALGFKLTTALVQPASAISAVPRVGAMNLMWAYSNFARNPRKFIRTINEISEQMAGRDNAWQRDIGDLLDMSAMKRFRKMGQLDRNMFFGFIRTMDKVGAYPTWYAGWRKAMKKYDGDSDRAVMFADRSVRMTQPQSSLKDLPNIMKGAEWKRSITMFYSYYNVLMNQTTELMQRARFGDAHFMEVVSALNFMYVIPPIVISIAKEREINPDAIIKNMATHVAGGIPIARDMMSAAVKGYDYTLTPVQDVFEVGVYAMRRSGTAVQQLVEDDFEFTKGDIYMGIKAAGYGFGIPSAQAMTMVSGLMDYADQEDTDLLDVMLKRAESKRD